MLPREYTRVEYIESTGSQYIDTGFKSASSNIRIVIEFAYVSIAVGQSIFGTQAAGGSSYGIVPYMASVGTPMLYCGTSSRFLSTSVAANAKNLWDITVNNGVATWDRNGNVISAPYTGTIAHTSPYYVFANNNGGSVLQQCSAKLYRCKFYSDDILIRDFVPCINSSGVAGLYDLVNQRFYINSGSGEFKFGAIIPRPSAPASVHTAVSVLLRWEASDGAISYNIYRDGALIGSTASTEYVDTGAEENREYTYGISAVGDGGEGNAAQLTVYTRTGYFMYKPVIQTANFP